MIGRLLEAIPDRVGSPLSRRETVRCVLQFWGRHGADWMPFQQQLERYVKDHARFHFDERSIRKIFDALVEARILHRVLVPPRTVQFRLDRRFADPMWRGFAREIDDLLDDPVPWPTADGRFFKVGVPRPDTRHPYLFMVPTRPHYFASHVWTRAWIHALNYGFFEADPRAGLELVRSAVREAPLLVIGGLYRRVARIPVVPDAVVAAIEQARMFAETAPLLLNPSAEASRRGKPAAWYAEEAIHLLHRLCGHATGETRPPKPNKGGRPWNRPATPVEGRVLGERLVYELLDDAVYHTLYLDRGRLAPGAQAAMDGFVRQTDAAYAGPGHLASGQSPGTYRIREPPLGLLVPLVRRLEPRVRHTMTDHTIAWKDGEVAPIW